MVLLQLLPNFHSHLHLLLVSLLHHPVLLTSMLSELAPVPLALYTRQILRISIHFIIFPLRILRLS